MRAILQAIPVSLHKIPVSLHVHSTPASQTVHHVACSNSFVLGLGFSGLLKFKASQIFILLLQNATEGHSTTENTGLNVKQIFL